MSTITAKLINNMTPQSLAVISEGVKCFYSPTSSQEDDFDHAESQAREYAFGFELAEDFDQYIEDSLRAFAGNIDNAKPLLNELNDCKSRIYDTDIDNDQLNDSCDVFNAAYRVSIEFDDGLEAIDGMDLEDALDLLLNQ